MSIKFLIGLNTGAPFHLIQKENRTIDVTGKSVPVFPESDAHHANGRVKPIMDIIKSGNLGLTSVDVDEIGDKNGNSIDKMTPFMAKALEEIVIRAQIEAGVDADKVTSDYNDETIGMVAQFLDKRGEDSASFTQNRKSLDTREGSNKHSAFDASYTRGKVDVQDVVKDIKTQEKITEIEQKIKDTAQQLKERDAEIAAEKAKLEAAEAAQVKLQAETEATAQESRNEAGDVPDIANMEADKQKTAAQADKPQRRNGRHANPDRKELDIAGAMAAAGERVDAAFNDMANDPMISGKAALTGVAIVAGGVAAANALSKIKNKGSAPTVKSGMSEGLFDQKNPNPDKQTNKQRADAQKAQPQTSKQAKQQQALDTKKHELNSKKSLLESKEEALKEAKKAAHQADIKGAKNTGKSGGMLDKATDFLKKFGRPGKMAAGVLNVGAAAITGNKKLAIAGVLGSIPLYMAGKKLLEGDVSGAAEEAVKELPGGEVVLDELERSRTIAENRPRLMKKSRGGLNKTGPAKDEFANADANTSGTSLEQQTKLDTPAKTAEFIPPGQDTLA